MPDFGLGALFMLCILFLQVCQLKCPVSYHGWPLRDMFLSLVVERMRTLRITNWF